MSICISSFRFTVSKFKDSGKKTSRGGESISITVITTDYSDVKLSFFTV